MYRYNSILQIDSTPRPISTTLHTTPLRFLPHSMCQLPERNRSCLHADGKQMDLRVLLLTAYHFHKMSYKVSLFCNYSNKEGQIRCQILVDFFLRSHKLLFKKNDNEIYREELPMWDLDISGFRWISKNVLLSWEFMVCESSFRALFWFIHNTHGHLHNFIKIHTHNSCNPGNIIDKLVFTCIYCQNHLIYLLKICLFYSLNITHTALTLNICHMI